MSPSGIAANVLDPNRTDHTQTQVEVFPSLTPLFKAITNQHVMFMWFCKQQFFVMNGNGKLTHNHYKINPRFKLMRISVLHQTMKLARRTLSHFIHVFFLIFPVFLVLDKRTLCLCGSRQTIVSFSCGRYSC